VTNLEKLYKQIEEKAEKDNVPILHKDSRQILISLVALVANAKILEIGTGIGYSGLLMLDNAPNSTLITIDKRKDRFLQAAQNFKKSGFMDRVKMLNTDASDFLKSCNQKFDFIFFDAAMYKYPDMFLEAKKVLNKNAVMVFDNVLKLERTNKTNEAKILQKVDNLIALINSDKNFTHTICNQGEGLCVVKSLS